MAARLPCAFTVAPFFFSQSRIANSICVVTGMPSLALISLSASRRPCSSRNAVLSLGLTS